MTPQQPPAPGRPDLVAFAERILEDWPGWWSFIEAKDVQAIALACGLLERVIVTKPCGEPCHCAEYHAFDGEAVECYRRVDLREATESVVHLLHQSLPLNERHGYCWCSGPDNPALARHLDTCPEQIRQRFEAALASLPPLGGTNG